MSWRGDPNAFHQVVDGEIAGLTEKASPVDADWALINDSADGNSVKKAQLGNLPGGGDPATAAFAATEFGSYAGDGNANQSVSLSITAAVVFVWGSPSGDDVVAWSGRQDGTAGLGMRIQASSNTSSDPASLVDILQLAGDGQSFDVQGSGSVGLNESGTSYFFVALGSQAAVIGDGSELTISAGVVTKTQGFHTVDTESDAATDDLDTINGGTTGDLLVLKSAADGRDPTLKDGTGNLALAGDFTLSDTDDTITLIFDGSNWCELSRSDNA